MDEESCAVPGCENRSKNDKHLRFYTLPKDEERLVQWVTMMNREDILREKNPVNYKICSTHFDTSALADNKLPDNAVPSLHLPIHEDEPDEKVPAIDFVPCKIEPVDIENGSESNAELPYVVKVEGESSSEKVHSQVEDIKDKSFNDEDNDSEWEDLSVDDGDDIESVECEDEEECFDESDEEYDEEYNQDEEDDDSPDSYDEDAEDEQDEEQLDGKLKESPFADMLSALPAKKNFEKFQKLIKKKFDGKRNTVTFWNWAMRLYFSNPELYKMLATKLEVPSAKDLLSRAKINFQTGTNKGIVSLLGRKVRKMPKYEYKKSPWLLGPPTKIPKNPVHYKYCTLCIQQVDLVPNLDYDSVQDFIVGFHDINGNRGKEQADKAIVMMVRGCHEVWRQVIGYGFVAENREGNVSELNGWLDETLNMLKQSGFNVFAVVTSDDKIFIDLANSKGVSAKNPSFTVGSQKYLYMFDVPHLMNSTRDLFMVNDFEYGEGKTATWKHIEYFHGLSTGMTILQKEYVNPSAEERKQVVYAAGIFSQKVSAYLHMTGKLKEGAPPKMIETAEFLMTMYKTFDILNCNTTKKRAEYNKYKRPYKGDDYQWKQLKEALEMFSSMKIKADDQSTDIFDCWQVTITAVLELFALYKSHKLDYMLTRRLNTEPIGWFMEFVQKRVSFIESEADKEDSQLDLKVDRSKVTPWKFRAAYSQVVLRDLMTNSLVTKSGEGYDNFLLGDKFDITCMFSSCLPLVC